MIHDNIIYQDNQSAIKLDNNGRWLSINSKRHINISDKIIPDIYVPRPLAAWFHNIFSSLIALWLSWYMIILWIVYPCSFRKYRVHITWVSTSSTPTRSASVKLLVFGFCFLEFTYAPPFPMIVNPPVWLLISLCTASGNMDPILPKGTGVYDPR